MFKRCKLRGPILFGIATIFLVANLSAEPNEEAIRSAPAPVGLAERLSRPSSRERLDAYGRAVKERDAEVASLRALADRQEAESELNGSRKLAIDLLAHYGAREAVPMYVKSIEYYAPELIRLDVSPLIGYPCALALSKIGLSAQPEVFMFLRTTSRDEVSDEAIELYAHLMLELYGTNEGGHEEALEVVRRATDRSHGNENMQRLLDKLQAITANYQAKPPAEDAE